MTMADFDNFINTAGVLMDDAEKTTNVSGSAMDKTNVLEKLNNLSKSLLEYGNAMNFYMNSMIYIPRNDHEHNDLLYNIYYRPILACIALFCFILILLIMRVEKNRKPYTFIILQSLFEVCSIIIGVPFQLTFLLSTDPIKYEYCEVYRVFTRFLPKSFFVISQWMKIWMLISQYLMFALPLRARHVLTKQKLITGIVIGTIVIVAALEVVQFKFKMEKVYKLTEDTNKPEYYCRRVYSPILGEYRTLISFIFSSFLPTTTFIVFGIGLSIQIRNRNIARQHLTNNQHRTTSYDFLANSVRWNTCIFIITLTPLLILDATDVYVWAFDYTLSNSYVKILSILFIASDVAKSLNIIIALMVNLTLKRQVRERLLTIICTPLHYCKTHITREAQAGKEMSTSAVTGDTSLSDDNTNQLRKQEKIQNE